MGSPRQLHLHHLRRALHPLAEVDELAGHRAARRLRGRDRHAAGHRRHAARASTSQLGVDPGGVPHRHRGRRSHRLHHADDRGAAADRACRTPAARWPPRWSAPPSSISGSRTPHRTAGFVMVALVIETLLGFLTFTGSLMAMGKLQEILPSRPITYRNQNADQLPAVRHRARPRRAPHPGPHRHLALPDLRRPRAALRRAADHPDRRRRHAHRDRAAELLRRPLGLRHGLRAGQQSADHRRRARWLVAA